MEWKKDQSCQAFLLCPAQQVFNVNTKKCELPCPSTHTYNPQTNQCTPPPEEKNCGAQGANPVDYASGEKLRRESIISVGTRQPITLTYFYNNGSNHEMTAAGAVGHPAAPRTIVKITDPIPRDTYTRLYTEKGLLKTQNPHNQYYGAMEQYWRHNFDDVLQIRGTDYRIHWANGEQQAFSGLGVSKSHPTQALLALAAGEETFTGYKWVNRKTGVEKRFDSTGKLRKIVYSPDHIVTLTYTDNRLTRIANGASDSLSLGYLSLATNSLYSVTDTLQDYVSQVTASSGQSAQLEWKKSFRGQTATFHLLTRITEATTGSATAARDFAYNDSRWPASLTDIYTVTNIAANTKKLYAHFEYDTQGRAIYSSLANGAEAVTVNYVDELTRTVTNTLGKDATYSFAMVEGVKRLKKVVGEPTTSCLRSEVEYNYNTNGTLFETIQNNKTTRYTQYDTKNREIERVEAFGTPEARTIKTEYHPTLNVKTKVIEPKTTTLWEYFDNGQLKSTTTQPRTTD
jgi:hypothetical protein